MPHVLDIEQSLLLLELEPPFDKRDVQLARRRLAKVWQPDIAPPGKQLEHERHLKAINEAATSSRRWPRARAAAACRATRSRWRGRRPQARPRRGPGLRGGAARPRETRTERTDPFASRFPTTRSSTATHAASPIPNGAWDRHGHLLHGRRRRHPAVGAREVPLGVRTVPADSLQFVDFSKPDPGAERVERFMIAAQHALHEGDYQLAARGWSTRAMPIPSNAPSCG